MCKLFPILLICFGFSANLHEVSISNNAFSPSEITIEVRDTIRWTNEDSWNHTATEDNGEWDSGTLSNGATFKQVFLNTDTLEYHCSIHTSMTGKVIVRVIVPFGFREEDWSCDTDGCVWENQNDPESSCNIGECNGYANGATRDGYKRFFRQDITCECEGNVCCDPNTLSCVGLCFSSSNCPVGQPELGHKAICQGPGGYFRDPDRSDGDTSSCKRPFGDAAAGVPAGEANVGGETGTAVGDSVCCGDDSVDGGTNWETPRACSDSSLNDNCDNTSKVCCSYATSCVDQTGTTCHETGACYGPNIMGNSYCNDGGWEDPDESQDYCESCGYTWTGSECCGDDSSESIENGECVCGSELDDCGVCGGSTTFGTNEGNTCDCDGNVADCAGVCGGSSYVDQCGVCDDNANTDCYDLTLDLHEGANLISFPCLPEDVSVANIFAGCDGVIGEGVGAVNLDGTWIGSLTEVSQDDGYWVKVSEDTTIEIEDCVPVNYDEDGIVIYEIHFGNNLISYPFVFSQAVGEALGDDAENVYAVAGEGVATLNSSDAGGWVGSLVAFEGGKGYWLVATTDFVFTYNGTADGLIHQVPLREVPEIYSYTQSDQQAFYIVKSVSSLNAEGDFIDEDDIIIAYNGDVIVGARYWDGEYTDVPAMGVDSEGGEMYAGYCEAGDKISFKVFDASTGELVEMDVVDGNIEWSVMGISIINLCSYPEEVYLNCDGTCITDTDGDSICDEIEIVGCQDDSACNYDETATDSGDCIHTNGICDTCIDGVIVDNDSDDDTVCDDMDACEDYDDTVDSDGDGTPDGCDLSIYEGIIPNNYSIASIYPNPFNPVTNIIYGLPEHVNVQILVYDLSGKQLETLINEFQTPGYHSVNWNASSYPSGMYFVKMVTGEFTQTQKLVLIK